MKKLTILFAALFMLTGCTQGGSETDPDSSEPLTDSVQILSVTVNDSSIECYDESVDVTLYVRNDSAELMNVNSLERETNLQVRLLNENGRGQADNQTLLAEPIEAGAVGEIYAYFGGLFIGFEGTFNRLQVLLDGKVISEKEIDLSRSCFG